ncbi:c-type cytochrome [Nannocystis pusilla]|uniref:c-type cytochrome n=1 Tax=Nannocystis pusilla TaxID=889268 RepID=UPI003B830FD9
MTLNIKLNTATAVARLPVRGFLLAASCLLGACEAGPPPFTEAQVLGGVEVPASTLNHGQKLFNRYCASCHGYDGGGKGPRRATSRRETSGRRTSFISRRRTTNCRPTATSPIPSSRAGSTRECPRGVVCVTTTCAQW